MDLKRKKYSVEKNRNKCLGKKEETLKLQQRFKRKGQGISTVKVNKFDQCSPLANISADLNKTEDPRDNLNINKRGVQIKGRVSEKCYQLKVATRYH